MPSKGKRQLHPQGLKQNSPGLPPASPHQRRQNRAPNSLAFTLCASVCPWAPPSLPPLSACTCWLLHLQHPQDAAETSLPLSRLGGDLLELPQCLWLSSPNHPPLASVPAFPLNR